MSLDQIYQCTPTVYPADPFNARDDAAILQFEMHNYEPTYDGSEASLQPIIDLITHRVVAQRLEIAKEFETMYDNRIYYEITRTGDISDEFDAAFTAMTVPLPQYYADELENSMYSLYTNEDSLIEILVSLNNSEMKTANRDENPEVDKAAATRDAEMLFEAADGQWETYESTFNSILITKSFPQLREIFQEYERISDNRIEDVIERKVSGPLRDGYLAVVKYARDRIAFFAERLHKALSGWGSDLPTLLRIVIGRSEIDLGDIKEKYQTIYGESLACDIDNETTGNCRGLLLGLLG